MPDSMIKAAKKYVKNYGFRNIQDLALESMREKIFEKSEYDESFTGKEIKLIDELISSTIKKRDFGTEEELMRLLRK